MTAWTAAGFPASKIVLGIPSYGYISRSSAAYLQTRAPRHSAFRKFRHFGPPARGTGRVARGVPMHLDGPVGGAPDAGVVQAEGAGAKLVANEDGGTNDGQVQFRDLVRQGILQYVPAWSAAAARVASVSSSAAVSGDDSDGSDSGHGAGGSSGDSGDGSDDSPGSRSGAGSDDTPPPYSNADTDSDSDPDATTLNTLSFAGHQISNVFTALQGFERKWDACSSTPYLRSAAAGQVVTYDDPQSVEMKAVFARYAGLLGVNMFDVHGDTDTWDLTDAMRRGLGL